MQLATTAAASRDQFLQLLVTQLRNQDPLEPTKQEDFIQQLAQFSTLEGIEQLNENLDAFLESQQSASASQNAVLQEALQSQQLLNAAALIGNTVHYEVDPGTVGDQVEQNDQTTHEGVVEGVLVENGETVLRIGSDLVSAGAIREIVR